MIWCSGSVLVLLTLSGWWSSYLWCHQGKSTCLVSESCPGCQRSAHPLFLDNSNEYIWVISHEVLAKNMGWLGSDLLTIDFSQQTTTSKVGQKTVNYKSVISEYRLKLYCRFESVFVYLYQEVSIFVFTKCAIMVSSFLFQYRSSSATD